MAPEMTNYETTRMPKIIYIWSTIETAAAAAVVVEG